MKTVLITGANKGIGFALAKELVAHGVHVLVGARDEARGQAAVEALRAFGNADLLLVDVADLASVAEAAQFVLTNYPDLDVLVNNAGIPGDMRKVGWEFEPAELEATLQTNFIGPFALSKALLPILRANEGRILNVTIPTTPIDWFNPFAYQTSKASLNVLTQSWALSLTEQQVPVEIFGYMPGGTTTDLNGNMTGDMFKTPTQVGENMYRLLTNGENYHGKILNWDEV